MDEDAISVKDINISFNGVQILHNINLDIKKGEIHSIVGTNGAGKSTFVKILNGVYTKDSGEIKIFGKEVNYNSPEDAKKAGIAMVFQELSLIPTMTVTENIFLNHYPYKKGILLDDKKSKKRVKEILEQIGVESEIDPDAKIENLSASQQQIVEIAKALSFNSKILILDEPTATLSIQEAESLLRVIKGLKEKGITIIYITHLLEDVFKVSDRVTVFRDGRKIMTEETKKIDLKSLVSIMTNAKIDIDKLDFDKKKDIRESLTILKTKNLTTSKVKDINIEIHAGEIVGIAGLGGSGQTELLKAIFGIDTIKKGEILINGERVNIKNTTHAIDKGISFVPENRREEGLILEFSVLENIILPIVDRLKRVFRIDTEKSWSITEDYIKKLNIKCQGPHQTVKYLSGGNQQKTVLAKCLASKPKIMLLDDPTFGVDVGAKQGIMRTIQEFASEGNSVIFVSSQLEEFPQICDSIYIMKHGTITDLVTSDVNKDDLLYLIQ